MLDLSSRLKQGLRPQPLEELTQAFVEFFKAKDKESRPLEDVQVQHAMTTFNHLQAAVNVEDGPRLSSDEIRLALRVLKRMSKEYKTHSKLARVLFDELQKRRATPEQNGEESVGQDQELVPFIVIMAQSGNSLYARELIERNWYTCLKDSRTNIWTMLFANLIYEKRSDELQKTVDMMQKFNQPFDARIHQAIVSYFAGSEENMELTKAWYDHPITTGDPPSVRTDALVLKLCIKKGEMEWGDSVFRKLVERGAEDLSSWNTIFQWSAAKGKSVDEIERMIQVMIRRGEEKRLNLRPDMNIINSLIWLANYKDDPYTAERYLALGSKFRLRPNARTYLLQLDYRLKVGDLDGARSAYARLQGEEVPKQEDLPLINRLMVALCNQTPPNYDVIMDLAEDLSERKTRFEPETVAALAGIHLQRDEIEDLVDLLNTHAFHYGLNHRAMIRDVLVNHCLDPATPTLRAWESYNTLRQTFGETDVPTRVRLMNNFFARGQSDMAIHVFGHMRQMQVKNLRPAASTYAQCLAGIGRAGDLKSLRIVHNMIKLDNEIELDTQLYNGLMLGYSGCGDSSSALQFWEDIVHSREGPSYASIQIALRACERHPSGEREAKGIWNKLQRFEIEITKEIYAAYVGALAGRNFFYECVELVKNAERDVGYQPDALL